MRVTQGMLIRNYSKNLTRNIKNLADSNERLATKRKFNRVSDDTAASAKSFSIREQLYKNEIYLQNATQAKGELAAAEDNISGINNLLKSTIDRVIEGLSDTKDASQRKILAEDIDKMADQVLTLINNRYSDKFVFGGSANEEPPFKVGEDGHLLFNGQSVLKEKPFPQNIDTYVDIGLGLYTTDKFVAIGNATSQNPADAKITISGVSKATSGTKLDVSFAADPADPQNLVATMKDEGGNVIGTGTFPKDVTDHIEIGGVSIFSDKPFVAGQSIEVPIMEKPVVEPASAFNPRTSGIDVLGYGVDETTGLPNNVYEIMKEMSKCLKEDNLDRDRLNALLEAGHQKQNGVVIALTNVGTKSKFIEYNVDRLTADNATLQKTRSDVEDVKMEEESIFNKVYESSWLITLQLGTKIIPPSIFDYMR